MRERMKAPMDVMARSASSSIGRNQCQTWIIAGHSSTTTSTPTARARAPSPTNGGRALSC
jgi:hypothetical protein